ncbi:MAG: glutamate--cysteine ligase [Sandaracinaceae bacterium]
MTEQPSPIRELDDLLRPFHEAETARPDWRVGTEAEKFGVRTSDGSTVPFLGRDGVQEILRRLQARHGWSPYREHADGELIALTRNGASITLEPGAQLELSGAPLRTIHETCAEFRGHLHELSPISESLGITWLGLGFHPLATRAELPWVPKLRYGVMKDYLPTRGSLARDMMKRTATVQANFDYESEADAVKKLRTCLALSPITTAMFANSPFVEGERTGECSRRARVWLDVDPDRSGLLPFAWSEDFGYRQYVEWALDAPMFMVQRGAKLVMNTGQSFRAFMADGYEGATATYEDWVTHLNTLFPEVRLKRTLEIRGADSQPTSTVCALPALYKGILHDDEALEAASQLVAGLDYETAEAARPAIAQHGVRATLADRPIVEWAQALLEIASAGLARINDLDAEGRDERLHLRPVEEMLTAGQCPADRLLEVVRDDLPLLPQLLEHARL